ncbi:hypothetical protein CBR_g21280 [Chara braunii]|uniref:DUF659 domain-containing protein n=1 Tax=Chara braunii TaxID=69332 RepID=A0A388L158_CHABU|nr:hypothetical protein CBR_g21280 [Chara braunii]|eukprot:GBG76040.1 hypothetical protein CBR_g21280 [Chara braunii]
MLRCVFCGNEWQGNRHGPARLFRSVKGCSQVTDEALMEMHYTSGYAFEGKWLERICKYEELHGPWVDERRTGGGQAQAWAASNAPVGARQQGDDVIDLDGEGEDCRAAGVEGEVEAAYSQRPVLETAMDIVAGLKNIQEPFDRTGATIMFDGRKSRDGKPIVNFLAAGARGVKMYSTLNSEGETDDALAVSGRWISIFYDFGPDRVNTICTDSASAYVKAGNALADPHMRPEYKRIMWLPYAAHVCNKLLPDIGTAGPWCVDIIVHARAVVHFIKMHGRADFLFRRESRHLRLLYSCETRFASVYAMLEHLVVVRRPLERMVDGTDWLREPWATTSIRQHVRWVRWQIRHGSWWDSMDILCAVMEPAYDLLHKMDRGGLCMSRVAEWTGRLARELEAALEPLEDGLADQIVRCLQERIAHMCEPAHAAACLLCPMRRSMQYYSGVCIALRVLYMWTCSFPAERKKAIHESIHTKKRNRLLFQKVTKLVEITANTRLLALQSAGGGLVLPWTQDESMLDFEGGLEADAVCEGVDHNIPEEDRDEQAQLWRRDACGSRPPPPVEDVFGVRAVTLRPYPRDDSSGDEREEADEGFRPHGSAAARPLYLVVVTRSSSMMPIMRGHHTVRLAGGDHAMESSSMRDFMAELEATLPSITEGESIVVRHVGDEDVGPQPQTVHMGESAPDTEEERMAREAREDEEEAARTKALADADPRTHAMAHDMEAMRHLETRGEGVHDNVAEDDQMEGSVGSAHTQTLEFRGLVVEAAAHISHAVQEREGETPAPDIDSAPIVPLPPDGEADAVAVVHDGEARCETVVHSTVPEADAAQVVAPQIVDSAHTTQLGDPGAVPGGDVEDEEAVGSPTAVGGDAEIGETGFGRDMEIQRSRRRPPRYVEQPRGSLMFGAMTVDQLGTCLATDLTETRRGVRIGSKKGKALLPRMQSISWGPASPTPPSDASLEVGAMGVGAAQSPPSVAQDRGARPSAPTSAAGRPRERGQATAGAMASLLGRTDIPWSNTRRSTSSTRKRQPGLERQCSSTSSTREVHAAWLEHRGGSGAEVEGAGGRGSAVPGARVSTHELREVSQILRADVLGPPRTQRPIPRRASRVDGETTGGEGLEMMRGRRRTDTLLAASQREMRLDGVTVVDDDQTDVAAEDADGEEDLSIHAARRTTYEL